MSSASRNTLCRRSHLQRLISAVGVGSDLSYPPSPLRAHAMFTAPIVPMSSDDAPGTHQIFIQCSLPWQRRFVLGPWRDMPLYVCPLVSQRKQTVSWDPPQARSWISTEAFPSFCVFLIKIGTKYRWGAKRDGQEKEAGPAVCICLSVFPPPLFLLPSISCC